MLTLINVKQRHFSPKNVEITPVSLWFQSETVIFACATGTFRNLFGTHYGGLVQDWCKSQGW
jgi:hypothetical protein